MLTPHTPEIKQTSRSRDREPVVTRSGNSTGFGGRFATWLRLQRLVENREFCAVDSAHRAANGRRLFVKQSTLASMLVVRLLPLVVKLRSRLLPDRRLPNANCLLVEFAGPVVPQAKLTPVADHRFVNFLRR